MKKITHSVNNLLLPTSSPEDWRCLLADPVNHWAIGYSARSLAYSWEEADGFPPEVRTVFASSTVPAVQEAEMLLGIPEHKVPLPGGSRPSQSDIWVLARGGGDLISVSVEGKVSEPFGPTVGEWLEGASAGKRERLAYLSECLGLQQPIPADVRYQLLHRTASAVIEARRFTGRHAVLLVHSFSQTREWLTDYQRFLQLFGVEGDAESMTNCGEVGGIALHAAWVTGAARFLSY